MSGNNNETRTMREITMEELSKHNTAASAWMAINGKVYDVTDYISRHPGGRYSIMQGIGKDATAMFMQIHRYVNPDQVLPASKLVGVLKRSNIG